MAGEYFGEHSLRALVQLIKQTDATHIAKDDIVNSLQSDSTDKPVAALQAKILYDMIKALDSDGDGVVDNAASLNGLTADDIVKLTDIDGLIEAMKNTPNGIAGLDENGKILQSLIPLSALSNIIEGYVKTETDESGKETYTFYSDSGLTEAISGESNKVYIDITSDQGAMYRYNGSAFIPIAAEGKEITEDDVNRIWDSIEV